ncbi:hypothetical protein CRENBAI_025672 [Crenichthys baileyi]|uniref:Uncharacterized protein n=1 Tax=Crenichthys baileyi TaxID=28760 RepID=A0AAV9R617_9TELE
MDEFFKSVISETQEQQSPSQRASNLLTLHNRHLHPHRAHLEPTQTPVASYPGIQQENRQALDCQGSCNSEVPHPSWLVMEMQVNMDSRVSCSVLGQ